MKIIDAHWEKRNLGMDVVEITLNAADFINTEKTINFLAENHTDKYTVIKSPVGNLEVLHRLQDNGFYFMETQLILGKNIQEYAPPKALTQYAGMYSALTVPKEKWPAVIDKVKCLYQTDRIYLDPLLDANASDSRYRNWINDLSHNPDSIMYEIAVTGESTTIGYGIVVKHESEHLLYSLLTGIYPAYQGKGLGGLVIHTPITLAKQLGYSQFKTAISSNNIKVMKKHLPFGFDLSEEYYVLRRHPDAPK